MTLDQLIDKAIDGGLAALIGYLLLTVLRDMRTSLHAISVYLARQDARDKRKRASSGETWTPPFGVPIEIQPEVTEKHRR